MAPLISAIAVVAGSCLHSQLCLTPAIQTVLSSSNLTSEPEALAGVPEELAGGQGRGRAPRAACCQLLALNVDWPAILLPGAMQNSIV